MASEEKQAYCAYQKAVLCGLQNAEDAPVRYETEQQRFVALQEAAKAAHQDLGQQFIQYATLPGTFAIWYSRGVDPRKGAQ